MIEELDDSEDGFSSNLQKILILQLIQNIICKNLIVGRKTVYTDSFFEVTNTRKDVKNDSPEFDGLLHEMVSKGLFINQEISYMKKKGEMNCSSVSDYIKKY